MHYRCAETECLVLTLIVPVFHIKHDTGVCFHTQVCLYKRQRGCETAFGPLSFSLFLTTAFNRGRSDFTSLHVKCVLIIFLYFNKRTKVFYPLNL